MHEWILRIGLHSRKSREYSIIRADPYSLSFLWCSVDEVTKLLKKLKPRKSPGPVNPSIDTKKLCRHVSYINLSFSLGKIPDCCKQADIIPLYKKGAKNNCKNYHSVSLTFNSLPWLGSQQKQWASYRCCIFGFYESIRVSPTWTFIIKTTCIGH